ncbi:hypothetical protein [Listeria valentina]|uniref:hypothetical protein n=1 Tax=Listeria valentina TaxID=2705293 RepID=UPI001431255A|nr:hypothetical protein [Listeria valentina]
MIQVGNVVKVKENYFVAGKEEKGVVLAIKDKIGARVRFESGLTGWILLDDLKKIHRRVP